MLKSEVRTLIRQLIDDPDGARWTDTNLDLLTNMTYNRLWGQILRVNPKFLVQTDVIASGSLVSPGTVDLSTTGEGGSLTQDIFRIMSVQRSGTTYHEVSERQTVLDVSDGEHIVGPDYTWLAREEVLWLFPLDLTTSVEITYSYYPGQYSSLTDAALVPWVERHEDALIWATAAQALLKGAAEDNQMLYFQARDAVEAMLGAVQTFAAGPLVMTHETGDDTLAWGSRD